MSSNKKPEIITISSSESSDASYPMPWADYFPNVEHSSFDSGYDEMQFCQQKMGSNSNKVEASKSLTSKQNAKLAFADRIKVLGLPNKENCDLIGFKPFAVKNPKDAKDGSKGKGKKYGLVICLGLFFMGVGGLCIA